MKTVFQKVAVVCTFLVIALVIYVSVSNVGDSSNWPYTSIKILLGLAIFCLIGGWIVLPLMEPMKPAVIVTAKSKKIELEQPVRPASSVPVPETSIQPPIRSFPPGKAKATIIPKRSNTTIIAKVTPPK